MGESLPRKTLALDAIFLRIVAEGAVRHLQERRGLGADATRAFESSQQIRTLQTLDMLFQTEAFLRQAQMIPVVRCVRNRILEMVLDSLGQSIHGDSAAA